MRGQVVYDSEDDLDAYEEDGCDQGEDRYEDEGEEEEVGEEEQQEHEEEPPKPTKEELDYLSYRQRLKESIRLRMKKEYAASGASADRAQDKNKKLPYDNFGSFFGPSQPAIARRVIEEGRAILQTRHIHAKNSNSTYVVKKSPGSTTAATRLSHARELRDARDYSFLLSDDADVPGPANEPTSRNMPVPTSDARLAQVPSKNKPSATSNPSRPISNGREERKPVSSGHMNRNFVSNGRDGHEERRPVPIGPEERRSVSTGRDERRPVSNGREERRPVSSGREDRSFVSNGWEAGNSAPINRSSPGELAHSKVGTVSRPDRLPADSRKLLGSNDGNWPGRVKGPPPKLPSAALDKKKTSMMSTKSATLGQQKSPLSKSHSPAQTQYAEQKQGTSGPDKPKIMSKQPVSSSKPQMRPPKQLTARPMQEARPKKRPVMGYSDEEEGDEGASAINIIRRMFRYDPKKFQNDEDDSGMEASFDEILREERRSAKIAKKEDKIELRKIEEEERRERLRKVAKKRKLSHQ